MKYLKSLRRICVFLFLISVFFVLSKATVFSATCKTSSGSTGLCETTCTSGSQEDTSGTADCDYGTGVVFKCCVLNPSGGNGKCTDQSATSSQALCSTKCDDGQFIGKFDCSEGMFCCKKTPTTTSSSSSSTSASLNYTPLENLPGFEGQSGDFASYFGSLYKFALWIVGISALFMLVVGGFLYLSSAGNTSLLGTAKKTIYGALIGLVIALISWLLLDTINSDLTNLKLSGLSGGIGGSGNGGGSSATTPPSGDANPDGCKQLKNLSVNQSQCNLASKELVTMLSCMEGKGITNKWTSISAIAVGGDQNKAIACCGKGHTDSCPHSGSTCHHGCTFGTKGLSYAVDIGTSASASDSSLCAIANAAKSCGSGNIWGPRTLSCGIRYQDGHGTHLHISVSGCQH